ncbi:MAG: hypothetical protein WBA17_08670, partial [Saprospiraceae bacterium]
LSPAVRHWECDPLLAACEKLRIPAGRLRDLAEVFEWEEARALLLTEDGKRSVRTVVVEVE